MRLADIGKTKEVITIETVPAPPISVPESEKEKVAV